jgi:hypothetical protein
MNGLFGYDHVPLNEKKAFEDTKKQFPKFEKEIPDLIDLLCKFRYFFGPQSGNQLEKDFQWFCEMHFIQAPYTFKVIYELFLKGYYLETLILIRHLIESLVRMKYFNRHIDKLEPHLNNKLKITFKVMFNEFSPEIYKWYTDFLSEAAHGVFFKEMFQVDRKEISNQYVINGPIFKTFEADWIRTWIYTSFLAYLNSFLFLFPQNTLSSNLDLKNRLTKTIDVLKSNMDEHKKKQPDSIKFYLPFEKLIF